MSSDTGEAERHGTVADRDEHIRSADDGSPDDTESGQADTPERRQILRRAGVGAGGIALGGRAAADGDDDSPTRHIVGLTPGQVDVARDRAEEIHRELDFGDIGQAVSGTFPDEAIEALENNPNVRYVEENGRMEALGETVPYGIEKVEADVAIDEGYTGDGVSVAILDTGIDPHHETLEENLGDGWAATGAECDTSDDCEPSFFCHSNDIETCYEDWDDDNDHGTHVAGTAAAAMNNTGVVGVAPSATLHAVKVLDCCGSGSFDDIAAGIEWATDQGHDVINLSLGGPESDTVNDAVEYAANNNVVIVAAAGNSGQADDVSHPAAHPEVIAVSATDENDDLAEFSSYGPEVDIAAPGDDIFSSISRDDYAEFPGTSMAAPHVAGAAAQVIADGTTDREAVRDELKATAEDVGLEDEEQGAGRLNVYRALEGVFPMDTKWASAELGGHPQYTTPAVDDDHVYVGGLQQTFYALDRADGESVAWSFERGTEPGLSDSSPALWTEPDQNRVLFGSGQGKLYAVNADDGTEHWPDEDVPDVGSAITASPAAAGGLVFTGTNDGRVLAFEGDTAAEEWETSVGGPVYSDLLVHSGLVYVTTADGDLVVLDASDGAEQWRGSFPGFGSSSPVLGHGSILVAADEVYAYDVGDSKNEQWQSSGFGGTAGSNPTFHQGVVYVGGEDGTLYALDAGDGSIQWTFPTGGVIEATPAVTDTDDGAVIAVASMDGTVYLLDDSGDELNSVSIPADTRSSPVFDGDELFVPTHSGVVYAFE